MCVCVFSVCVLNCVYVYVCVREMLGRREGGTEGREGRKEKKGMRKDVVRVYCMCP